MRQEVEGNDTEGGTEGERKVPRSPPCSGRMSRISGGRRAGTGRMGDVKRYAGQEIEGRLGGGTGVGPGMHTTGRVGGGTGVGPGMHTTGVTGGVNGGGGRESVHERILELRSMLRKQREEILELKGAD